jgi:hypothetical protein
MDILRNECPFKKKLAWGMGYKPVEHVLFSSTRDKELELGKPPIGDLINERQQFLSVGAFVESVNDNKCAFAVLQYETKGMTKLVLCRMVTRITVVEFIQNTRVKSVELPE